MASRIARTSFIQGQRGLAAQAAVKKSDGSASGAKLQTTKLSNGLTVASLDTGSALSSLGVLVKCGSRHESAENKGVNHALRLAAGLTTSKHSSMSAVRTIQQSGGLVDVTGSREYTLYTSQVARNHAKDVIEYFLCMVNEPSFKPWEVNDQVTSRMATEVASLTLADIASESLHKAAFRDGLGNSLFAPSYMVGKLNSGKLLDFHSKNYTVDRTVLMGLDVDHDLLVKFGEQMSLPKGSGGSSAASKFHAGELRHETSGKHTLLAVAANSASASSVKEAVATRLLQNVLGFGPRVCYGAPHGKLQKAVANIAGSSSVSAINYSYSDAGLLGAFIASEANCAGKVLEAVVAALRSVNVSQEELNAAKKAMLLYLDDQTASPASKLEAMASHLAFGAHEAVTPAQMSDLFSNASLADVQAAAKKLSNAKFSLGAAGNVANVPYIDQL